MPRTKGPFRAPRLLLAVAAIVALAATASLLTTGTQAKQKNKKTQQPTTGRIEVSTQPGGYPITIDGQAAGETTDYVRAIELEPGTHTVEIQFPNDTRWSQVFNIIAGRNNCIALSYRPESIVVPAIPQSGGRVETVDLGNVTGTVCDCGEIPVPPISKVPWWKRLAGKKRK